MNKHPNKNVQDAIKKEINNNPIKAQNLPSVINLESIVGAVTIFGYAVSKS